MNKADLVDAVEAKLGNRKDAVDAVEVMIDTIVRTVTRGERVAISGFGTFERVARAARTGRNPRTGETVRIKKTSVPKFKPGTAFKAYVASPRSIPSATISGEVAVTSRGVSAAAAQQKAAAAEKRAGAATAKKSAAAKTTGKAAAAKTATKPASARKSSTSDTSS